MTKPLKTRKIRKSKKKVLLCFVFLGFCIFDFFCFLFSVFFSFFFLFFFFDCLVFVFLVVSFLISVVFFVLFLFYICFFGLVWFGFFVSFPVHSTLVSLVRFCIRRSLGGREGEIHRAEPFVFDTRSRHSFSTVGAPGAGWWVTGALFEYASRRATRFQHSFRQEGAPGAGWWVTGALFD
ncbi:hypothetical protein F4679DRAFT_278964 [Xylaria curta]|nr:hypothetical protein F4679DRAFT_278964 [Xylaria curta]